MEKQCNNEKYGKIYYKTRNRCLRKLRFIENDINSDYKSFAYAYKKKVERNRRVIAHKTTTKNVDLLLLMMRMRMRKAI